MAGLCHSVREENASFLTLFIFSRNAITYCKRYGFGSAGLPVSRLGGV